MKLKIVCHCGTITTNDIDKYIKKNGFPTTTFSVEKIKKDLCVGNVCQLCLDDSETNDVVDITINNYLKEIKEKDM